MTTNDAAGPEAAPAKKTATRKKTTAKSAAAAKGGNGIVDPLQWWGSLTQQFQEIAAGAMKDAAQKTAVDMAKNMAGGMAKAGMKAATAMAKKPARKKRSAG